MKKKLMTVFLGVLLFSLAFISAGKIVQAQSLWSSNGSLSGSANWFADHRAHNVGDILTILVNQTSTTSVKKSTSNAKAGSTSLSAGTGLLTFLSAASGSQSDSFKANGSMNDVNTVSAQLTVKVIALQPNGNMVVEGTQSIWQNKELRKITIRGVVRPEDVSYNNTVPSSLVSDASIRFDGKGPLSAKQHEGILTQLFNILF